MYIVKTELRKKLITREKEKSANKFERRVEKRRMKQEWETKETKENKIKEVRFNIDEKEKRKTIEAFCHVNLSS